MRTYPKTDGKYTSDYLQTAINVMRNTKSDLVDQYTPLEWLALYDAYHACGWDFTPDQWTDEQRNAAIDHGIIPRWDRNEKPLPRKRCAGLYIDANTGRILPCRACNLDRYLDEGALEVWCLEHAGIGAGEGWAIFNAGEGRPEVQRDDDSNLLAYDEDAYPLAAKKLSKAMGAIVSLRRWSR